MALVDRLEASFAEGGFDLPAAFEAVQAVIGGIDIDPPAIDAGGFERARELLADVDLGRFAGSIAGVAAQAGAELGRLPDAGNLVAPVEAALAAARLATPERVAALRATLEAAERIGSARTPGLAGVQDAIGDLASLPGSPGVSEVLDLVRGLLPVPLPIDAATGAVGIYGAGTAALVTKVGALMAMLTAAREVAGQARLVARHLNPEAARSAALRLQGMAGEGRLARLLDGIDPDDAGAAEALAPPLRAFGAAVDDLAEAAVQGLAFGEATLVYAGLERRAEQLEQASRALSATAVAPVQAMVSDIMGRLQPVMAIRLGDPAASLEAFWDEASAIVADLAEAIRNFDTTLLSGPLTAGVAGAADGLAELARAIEAAAAAIRNAVAAVRAAARSLDLDQIVEALRTALRPVAEALAELERLVAAGEAEIERVAAEIEAAVAAVRGATGTAADRVEAAFERLDTVVTAIDVQRLVDGLRDGVHDVANALQAIQLQPHFDAAADVIEAGAELLDAVPLDLLPDDVRGELEAATGPIKAIDFQRDVADVLKGRLDAILTSLDTDVLGELEAAHQEAVAFLRAINPREQVERFEREHFDPLIARIAAIDPSEILKPVSEALGEVRAAIGRLDPGTLLAPVEAAFDALLAELDGLDPAAVLAPVQAEIEALRAQVVEALLLDQWEARIDDIRDLALAQVDRLDIAAIIPPLGRGFDALIAEAGAGSELVNLPGTAAAMLAQGLRLPLDSATFEDVSTWIGGADGAAVLRGSLGSAAAALEETRDAVQGLELAAAVAAAQPVYRSLSAALTAMPETSPVRSRLVPLLAGASPADRLAAAAEGATRYAARLDTAAARLRELEGSGWSEVGAGSEDLRAALRPLAAVPQFLRGLFGRVGLDPGGRPLSALLAQLFAFLHPQRSLQPLLPLEAAIKLKARETLEDGIARPLRNGVVAVRALIDAVDLEPVRAELSAVHAEVRGEVEALRPSLLLSEVLAEFEAARATIVAFDPLGPAAAAVGAMQDALGDLIRNVRPSQRLAAVFALYDELVAAAGMLDVRTVLEPVLTALREIEGQLDSGLDGTAAALERLQEALP